MLARTIEFVNHFGALEVTTRFVSSEGWWYIARLPTDKNPNYDGLWAVFTLHKDYLQPVVTGFKSKKHARMAAKMLSAEYPLGIKTPLEVPYWMRQSIKEQVIQNA
jgi:hypothetical protein